MPAYVLVMITGTASATSEMYTGQMERPPARKTRVTRPTVGSARPKEARLTARNAPRPVWPISMPMGSAITAATTVASSEYWRCSTSRWAMPSGPDHWAELVSQVARFLRSSITAQAPRSWVHGVHSHWTVTSSASATRASSRVRTTPATTGVG